MSEKIRRNNDNSNKFNNVNNNIPDNYLTSRRTDGNKKRRRYVFSNLRHKVRDPDLVFKEYYLVAARIYCTKRIARY